MEKANGYYLNSDLSNHHQKKNKLKLTHGRMQKKHSITSLTFLPKMQNLIPMKKKQTKFELRNVVKNSL